MCQEGEQLNMDNMINRLSQLVNSEQVNPELSFSYGFASVDASSMDSTAVEGLIQRADNKMYEEKNKKKKQKK